MAELNVSILSPAKVVAKTIGKQVQAPGSIGYLGVLPGHAALVAELGVGLLTVQADAGKQSYFITGGYLDVANDQVTVLADIIENPADIDVKRAEKAKQRALERLGQKGEIDLRRAQAALARAEGRIAAAKS